MTGNGRLRVGGWIAGSDNPEYVADSGPLTGEVVVGATVPLDGMEPANGAGLIDVPEPFGYRATNRDLDKMDPATAADGDDHGAYRGRRRPATGDRPRRAVLLRRASIAAVAVGVLLVGTSVLARLLGSDSGPEPQLAPPPTPPQAGPSADSELGRLGAEPSGSPVPSGSAAPPTEPPVQTLSFEAEDAERGSRGQVVAFDGASGGQVVKINGNRDGTFVQFPGVSVSGAGRYELTVFYFSDRSRTAGVAVGDESPEFVTFPSRGEAGDIGSVTLGVQLASGANTVVIGTDGGAPLSIDRITVTG